MAGGVWEAMQSKASARARLEADGLRVWPARPRISAPAPHTVMTQIAADAAGYGAGRVALPAWRQCVAQGSIAGGSFTVSSVGSRRPPGLPAPAAPGPGRPAPGPAIRSRPAPPKNASAYAVAIWKRAIRDTPGRPLRVPEDALQVEVEAEPSARRKGYATATHSAVFVEVRIDEALVPACEPVVSAVAAGRVINPKTARSQILGGVVWGLAWPCRRNPGRPWALAAAAEPQPRRVPHPG
ncbi:molybdopterin cofactor-binding domain-containing protein [Pseudomonas aeruginosa]